MELQNPDASGLIVARNILRDCDGTDMDNGSTWLQSANSRGVMNNAWVQEHLKLMRTDVLCALANQPSAAHEALQQPSTAPTDQAQCHTHPYASVSNQLSPGFDL